MTNKNVVINLEIGHKATVRAEKTSDGYTHDWEVFVQGSVSSHIEAFIEKVVFYLHESFQKPKRVLKSPPYRVCEKGYGCFTLNIEVCFRSTEEPRKAKFEYDLYLQPLDNPPISKIRREKLTFIQPNDEFRKKLLQAGGAEIPSVEETKVNEKSQKTRPSSGAKTKPVARHHTPSNSNNSTASSDANKKSRNDIKKEPSKLKGSDQFTALFGEIIKPTNSSSQKAKESSNKVSKDTKTPSTKSEHRPKSKEGNKDTKSSSEHDKEHSKKESKGQERKKADVEKSVLDKERSHERDKKKSHEKKHKEELSGNKSKGDKSNETKHKSSNKREDSGKRCLSSSLSPERRSSKKDKRKEDDSRTRKEHNSTKEVKKHKSSSSKSDTKKLKTGEEKDLKENNKSKPIQPTMVVKTKEKVTPQPMLQQPTAKSLPPPPTTTTTSSQPPTTQKPPPPIPQRGRPRKNARYPLLTTSIPVSNSTNTLTTTVAQVPSSSSPAKPPPVFRESLSKASLPSSRVPVSTGLPVSSPKPPPAHVRTPQSDSSSRSRSPSLSLSSSSSRSSSPAVAASSRSSSRSHSPSPVRSRSGSVSSSDSSKSNASKSGSVSDSSSGASYPSREATRKRNSSRSSHKEVNEHPLGILAKELSETSSDGYERSPSPSPVPPVPPPPAAAAVSGTKKSPHVISKEHGHKSKNKEPPTKKSTRGKKPPVGPDTTKKYISPSLSSSGSEQSDYEEQSPVSSIKPKPNQSSPGLLPSNPSTRNSSLRTRDKGTEGSPTIRSPPDTVSNGVGSHTPVKTETFSPQSKSGTNYFDQLWDLRNKIMTSFSDRTKVQEIVKIISSATDFHVNHTHFTFDLCSLDKQTIKKLQQCLT